jgi:uncharacterized membrane protein YhaH (DUF805 family)
MGVRASYWMTGGILTLLGLVLARLLAGVLATITAAAGGFLLAAAAFLFKAFMLVGAVWLVLRVAKRRRRPGRVEV